MLLAERFELRGRVGVGGMGSVHEALDHATGLRVAVKLVDLPDAGAAARFAQEAQVLAALDHPGIVRHVAHGSGWLAMEWIEGEDLRARLRRGTLGVDEAVALAARVASALAAAHAQGAIHRDVKPSNILLAGGRLDDPRLIDFGVARVIAAAEPLTRAGVAIGTPAYMSPEQARGDVRLDGRSDLYSLGVVLFECLTGAPPHAGGGLAVMAKILFEPAPRLRAARPDAPAWLDDVVGRLLERTPALRPASAAQLASDLREGAARPASAAPALTADEETLVCVVLAVPAEPSGALAAAARRHDARIERLAGGGCVAALVSAGAATDLAARGASYALAAREELPGARIAVALGQAVAAGALPLGAAIEAAAALLDAPRPDAGAAIRIDGVTAGLIERGFQIGRDERSALLEGAGATLEGAGATHEGAGAIHRPTGGSAAPFVGRERERTIVETALAAALRGEPCAVVLIGPAGIGKSRLVAEVLPAARERVWIARGDPLRRGAPLGLLAPAVRQAAGKRVHDDEFLAELCGLPVETPSPRLRAARRSPILLGDQMRRAWQDLVLAETAVGPVVLVLEDLHWGDAPTMDLVDAALRAAAGRPFFVLATARPEVDDLFPALWNDHAVTRVALGSLDRGASERLIAALVGEAGADGERVARLAARGDGNPFYLEELARAGGDAASTPPTVMAMAVARLGQLDAEARLAARAASVFGETFSPAGVARLLGQPPAAVAAQLERLVELDWIAAGEGELRFRHALLRDAAYATLTDRDRLLGHRLAGEWLAGAGEPDALVLATHFEQGGDLAAAARAYGRAAEQSLAGNDLEGAIDRARRAARCGAGGEALGELRLIEAIAHHWRSEHQDGLICAIDALRLLPPLGARWYGAVEQIAEASLPVGDLDSMTALAATVGAPPAGDEEAMVAFVTAAATLGMQLALVGRHGEADATLARMEAALARGLSPPPLSLARAEFARATRAMVAGDLGRVIGHALAAIDAFGEIGDLRNATLMRSNVAYALIELGAYEEAEPLLRAAMEAAQRMGIVLVLGAIQNNLGLALARSGRLEEARAVEEEAAALFRRSGYQRFEALSRVYLSAIDRAAGELAAAVEQAAAAVALATEIPPMRAFALAALADALRARGDPAGALEQASAAKAILDELGALDEGESAVRLAWAEALLAAGQELRGREAAREAAEQVRRRAARISDPARRASFVERVAENARALALVT